MISPTVYRKTISWTMFNSLRRCPKQAEFRIREKEGDAAVVRDPEGQSYWAAAGQTVQYLYEHYFNQGVNLRKGGTSPSTIDICVEKVLAFPKISKLLDEAHLPDGKVRADLDTFVAECAQTGLSALQKASILDRPVRSEVPVRGELKGIPIFGFLDFLVEFEHGYGVYDGKINSKATADPEQLLFYSAAQTYRTNGARRDIVDGGFLYWRLGRFKPVDLGAAAVISFANTQFAEALPLMTGLRGPGLGDMLAKPTFKGCDWCNWSDICEASATRANVVAELGGSELVGLGEVSTRSERKKEPA